MKKRTLSLSNSLNNISQKKLLGAWIIYHAAVLLFFLISLVIFHGQIGVDSDLFNLVPKNISMASVKKADDKMMAVTSQNVFVLVANEDFSEAKRAAESVYADIKDTVFIHCLFELNYGSGSNGFSGAALQNCIFINCSFSGYPMRGSKLTN